MKHLLGAKSGLLATPNEDEKPEEITWREETTGKLDLVVSLDFRMTATPLYSDIVLPAATWYEKHDLSSTDMHPYVHPFNPAIILMDHLYLLYIDKTLQKHFQEMAKDYLPGTFKDVVTTPLSHDTKQEISTPYGVVKDWSRGPNRQATGRTMPNFAIVERDYTKIYDKYVTLGPVILKEVGVHVQILVSVNNMKN